MTTYSETNAQSALTSSSSIGLLKWEQVNEKKTSPLMKISTRQQSSECDWKPIEECKTAYLDSKVTHMALLWWVQHQNQ